MSRVVDVWSFATVAIGAGVWIVVIALGGWCLDRGDCFGSRDLEVGIGNCTFLHLKKQ